MCGGARRERQAGRQFGWPARQRSHRSVAGLDRIAARGRVLVVDEVGVAESEIRTALRVRNWRGAGHANKRPEGRRAKVGPPMGRRRRDVEQRAVCGRLSIGNSVASGVTLVRRLSITGRVGRRIPVVGACICCVGVLVDRRHQRRGKELDPQIGRLPKKDRIEQGFTASGTAGHGARRAQWKVAPTACSARCVAWPSVLLPSE